MRETAQTLADVIPAGQLRVLEGQEHNVVPEALAPGPDEYFKGQIDTRAGTPPAT